MRMIHVVRLLLSYVVTVLYRLTDREMSTLLVSTVSQEFHRIFAVIPA